MECIYYTNASTIHVPFCSISLFPFRVYNTLVQRAARGMARKYFQLIICYHRETFNPHPAEKHIAICYSDRPPITPL